MANIRDIKNRIVSIRNTRQITNAMKMVAASKLRKSQEKIIKARPYADYIDMMIRTIKYKNPGTQNPFLVSRENLRRKKANGEEAEVSGKTALLVFTADRGLCGSFNSSIIRTAIKYLQQHPETDIICVGRKGFDQLKRRTDRIIEKFFNYYNTIDFKITKDISRLVLDLYLNQGYDKIDVVYNEFKSAIQQNIITRQLLPIVPMESDIVTETDYLYEPDEDSIIDELGEKYIDVDIWRMMLESSAAEQGARMTAMDNATENASELIEELSLLQNRARQSTITTEIIEIASGAEAIKE